MIASSTPDPALALAAPSSKEGGVKAASLLPDADLIDRLLAAAIEAGALILEVRKRGHAVTRKADLSPVTEADHAAEAAILKHLAEIAPGLPVVAEEAVAAGRIPDVGREFFLVDPLDGTKEFVKGGDDFTVNIGLVRDGVPALGVVYAPATGDLYAGAIGEGAWKISVAGDRPGARTAIHVGPATKRPVRVVASKSHRTPETDAFIARYEVEKLVSAGSSLKFCLVAAGEADLYPRLGTTMQWDTAAGDAVVRAAGGKVVTLDGKPLPYGPSGAEGAAAFQNPWFVVSGGIAPLI
jgi:3'(2'),5'-bisphosphate nucleotidase